MTSRSPYSTPFLRMMAKATQARSGLRAATRRTPRPFLGTYDDSDDLDIPDAALGPDKTSATPST